MSESKYCLLGRLSELENKDTTLKFYKYNQKNVFWLESQGGIKDRENYGDTGRKRGP